MANDWKSYLPSSYVYSAKCHHLMKDFSIRGEGPDIVICTDEGLVLEFTNFRITGVMKTSCTDAKRIRLFKPYDSKNNYFYIIESEEEVIILTRKNKLEMLKQIKNVRKTMISDFENTGYPQIGIWTKENLDSDRPDILLDYNEDNRQEPEDTSIATILKEKYQELNINIEELKHQLEMKKQHRAFASEVFDHAKELPSSSELQLMQLVGEEYKEIDPRGSFKEELTLQLADTWQRTHNGMWIVGIVICNTGKRNIQDIDLVLRNTSEEKLSYETKLLMYNKETIAQTENRASLTSRNTNLRERANSFPGDDDETLLTTPIKRVKLQEMATDLQDWKEIDILECGRKGVLIGILYGPTFIHECIATIFALITYKLEGETNIGYQLSVPTFRCSVEECCKKSKAPFASVVSEADVLSVFLSSVTSTFVIDCSEQCRVSLPKILLKELKFEEYTSLGCLYNKGVSHMNFAGLMVHLNTVLEFRKYQITVSARDMHQIYLLVHCIYGVFSPPIVLVHPPLQQPTKRPSRPGRTHIRDELEFVSQELEKWIPDSDKNKRIKKLNSDIQVPNYEYSVFRIDLSKLEYKTEHFFSESE